MPKGAFIKPSLVGNHRKDIHRVEKALASKRPGVRRPSPMQAIRPMPMRPPGRFNMGGDMMGPEAFRPGISPEGQPDDSWAGAVDTVQRPPARLFGGGMGSQPNLPPASMFGGGMGGGMPPGLMELIRSMMQGRSQAQRPPWEGTMRPGGVMGTPPSGSYY